MAEFDLRALPIPERSRLLSRVVAPRPIAFVSSLSESGVGNLAPFSFFTAGGSNPPSVVFCTVNDRNGSGKHTLQNILETSEYVINIVTRDMAAGVNVASFEYPGGIDEFDVAGFTRTPSRIVSPPGVAESPVQLECRLHTVLAHGTGPSASNYIVGEVVHISVDDAVCTDGLPDNAKIEHLSRLGADYFTHIEPAALFSLARPRTP
jgi:flavin reductase (DIM6/NTAB) family NADH-FMN oxidoreductase RutF